MIRDVLQELEAVEAALPSSGEDRAALERRRDALISRLTALTPEDVYDVIFVVVRYTQLDSAISTLRANGTRNIVFVGNNVRARALAASLPEKNVLFAFASSA